MDVQKAKYFLNDLEMYRSGEIDEAAMVENVKYFLNEDDSRLQISEEEYAAIVAQYATFDELLAFYENLAKELISKGNTSTSEEE